MIPIRDHNRPASTPFVTYLLIAVNVGIFLYSFMLSQPALEQFILRYAFIPSEIISGENLSALFTAMFIHGSVGHIVSNMLFLHIFGDNLEDTLGHGKYLFFYLIAGLAASALQIVVSPNSNIPNLGASGAIAGLLGGYLVLFPNHKVDVVFPFFLRFSIFTVPAFTMLFYWIAVQFFSGFGQLAAPGTGGVAYFAHIGGFLAGLIITLVAKPFLRRGEHKANE